MDSGWRMIIYLVIAMLIIWFVSIIMPEGTNPNEILLMVAAISSLSVALKYVIEDSPEPEKGGR